jgi:deoxyribodipyrimidine photo-lyase
VTIHTFEDLVVVPVKQLKAKSSGRVSTIYSPFKKAWFEYVRTHPDLLKLCDDVAFTNAKVEVKPDTVPEYLPGFELDPKKKANFAKWYAEGEDVAHTKLNDFAETKMKQYKAQRDFMANDGTSSLSPYLAFGVLSAKQCVVAAKLANDGKLDTGSEGIVTWIQELIWRDFYKHILAEFPHVCMNRPFRKDTERVKWLENTELFQAWCEGRTGYPIVDAGMRQLNETGWMHNRARMITASFLSKHLLTDWRLGEKYFAQHLIDHDFSSNNGGWQWAASTGTDSQPYFRVFNPTLQAERFDSDGAYVCRWVPELKGLKNNKSIFSPTAALGAAKVKQMGYVAPIVEHEMARKRAIAAFKSLDGSGYGITDEPSAKKAKKT